MTLTIGSTFSGVGGFDLAAERVGARVAWQVEIDPAAQRVLQKRFPFTGLLSNIKEVHGADVSPVDVLVGGFPCQDLSVAGRRAGLGGERSGLFWEFARLVDELKPTWILLENVPGLLSSNSGRDMGTVVGALVERGYGWAYRVLDAQNWGVPQRRRRVFIVGHRGDWARAAAVLFERDGRGWGTSSRRKTGSQPSAPPTEEFGVDLPIIAFDWMAGHPSHTGGVTGQDGNNGQPIVGALQARDYKGVGNQYVQEGKLVVTSPEDVAYALSTLQKHLDREQTYVVDETASALTASNGHHGHGSPRGDGTDNLVATWDPRNVTSGLNRTRVEAGLPANTLHANGLSVLGESVGVRRLLPVECERLQGFPDGWTCVEDHPQPCDCPDGPRYRQMGNAVAVPVVEWILRRLLAVHLQGDVN